MTVLGALIRATISVMVNLNPAAWGKGGGYRLVACYNRHARGGTIGKGSRLDSEAVLKLLSRCFPSVSSIGNTNVSMVLSVSAPVKQDELNVKLPSTTTCTLSPTVSQVKTADAFCQIPIVKSSLTLILPLKANMPDSEPQSSSAHTSWVRNV